MLNGALITHTMVVQIDLTSMISEFIFSKTAKNFEAEQFTLKLAIQNNRKPADFEFANVETIEGEEKSRKLQLQPLQLDDAVNAREVDQSIYGIR